MRGGPGPTPAGRSTTVLPVRRWVAAAVAGTVLSGFAFLLLTGRYINDAPVLVRVSASHGLHLGDVFVLAGWGLGVAMLLLLARPYRRPVRRGPRWPPRR